MQQRISVLTIAADNLAAMKEFYEQTFEWRPVAENKDIIFYKLNGFLFSIGKRTDLAAFIGIYPEGNGFRRVTIAYNVETEQEVWELYTKLRGKGVNVLKEPTKPSFGGLFFYFSDIEDNIWEVAFNPYILLDEQVNVVSHLPIDTL